MHMTPAPASFPTMTPSLNAGAPAQLAQSVYRELLNKGLTPKDILALSGELIACITKNLAEERTAPKAN